MHSAPILLTRPLAASQAFADALQTAAERPLQITISPLLQIEHHAIPADAAEAEIKLFTSRNGVASWAKSELGVTGTAICVGPATTAAAAELGFDAKQGGANVEALIEYVIALQPKGQMLHIHGAHTRGNLVQRLAEQGLKAAGITAYDQVLLPLSAEAKSLLQGKERVIVPLFSPRTAAQFAAQCPKSAQVLPIALSGAVAAPVTGAVIAERPDAETMMAAVLSRI